MARARWPWMALLAGVVGCAGAPEPVAGSESAVTVHAASGTHPRLADALAAWAAEDLLAVSAALGKPVPEQAIVIACGWSTRDGGELELGAGENARHVRRGNAPCRILLTVAPDATLRTSLRHELVHHVLENERYPEWLNEGLAEQVSYALAPAPSGDDVHQWFHAGLVLAGWGRPLRVVDQSGTVRGLQPPLWVPDLPELLRMSHRDYERLVLSDDGEQDPQFHAASHVLALVLDEHAGAGAHVTYAAAVSAGADPWAALLEVTGLHDREAVLAAAVHMLGRAIAAAPMSERATRDFARSSCLWRLLPDAWGRVRSVQAYPGGPEISFRRSRTGTRGN